MSSRKEHRPKQGTRHGVETEPTRQPDPDARISEAEWEVMNVLWRRAPLSSYRVAETLGETTDWSPKTVKTLLSRLVKKGFLDFEKEANRYLYFPTVSRQESVRQESTSFLDRIFKGNAASMLLHFVEHTELSTEQRDELRDLLDRMDDRMEDEP